MGTAIIAHSLPLMYKDTRIGTFLVEKDKANPRLGVMINPEYASIAPLEFIKLTDEEQPFTNANFSPVVKTWFSERILPSNRHGVANVLKGLELLHYDKLEIAKCTSLASVRDDYWVRFDENDTFQEVQDRLVNELSGVSSHVGVASLIGMLEKLYDFADNRYMKYPSYSYRNKGFTGLESVTECIAFDLAKCLMVDSIKYSLIDTGDFVVCQSPNYVRNFDLRSVISADALLKKLSITIRGERFNALINLAPQAKLSLEKMLLFDYIICNTDRHLANFEFYLDENHELHLSPLFDNGTSLLSDKTDDELKELISSKDDNLLYHDIFVNATTPSKSFTAQHSLDLHMVSQESINRINLKVTREQIERILSKYSNYLTPLRKELIINLIDTRLSKLRSLKEEGFFAREREKREV